MTTQAEIAQHLDMSDRNLREVLNKLGMTSGGNTQDEIRVAYIRWLRDQAAGRGGDDQHQLTKSRAREAEASAHLKELQIAEKLGTLVPRDVVQPGVEAMIIAARTELLTMSDKIAAAIKLEYDIDIDESLVQDFVYESLEHLAATTSEIGADDVAGNREEVDAPAKDEHN